MPMTIEDVEKEVEWERRHRPEHFKVRYVDATGFPSKFPSSGIDPRRQEIKLPDALGTMIVRWFVEPLDATDEMTARAIADWIGDNADQVLAVNPKRNRKKVAAALDRLREYMTHYPKKSPNLPQAY